ncbi:MAG TPA: NTP transferase domain-containing protein [Actinomycetota bacterium]|nr:NTP transferase domain-containing protein [Actinomycetota bacterium]
MTPEPRALPRPRVGVVLAAGRSERLGPLTGGGSKALLPLGGLRLVERAIGTLLSLGVERVVVVAGYHAGPVAAVAQRTSPGRTQVIEADDWEAGNGASLMAAEAAVGEEPALLLITADHVFSEGALGEVAGAGRPAMLVDPGPEAAARTEATRVRANPDGFVVELGKTVDSPLVDCGVFLLPPSVFDAARAAREGGDATLSGALNELVARERLTAVPLRAGEWWQDVDTPEDVVTAARFLRRSLPRQSDGPVARLLNRRLSVPISWLLARFRPSPDLLSALSLAVGLASALFLGRGDGVLGGILAQACSVLDGVDGEVARLTLRAGPRGTVLDGFLDRLGDAAIAAGLGLWAAGQGVGPATAVPLVAAATAGAILSMATKDRVAALGLQPPSERRIGWLLGGRDGRLFLIAILAVVGQPVWALAVTAATSLLASALRVGFARHPPP